MSSVYRKEPIPSFLATIGLVNAVIGASGDRAGLFSFGLVTVGSAIAVRWWMQQQSPTETHQKISQTYLPPASSNSVPALSNPKRKRSK